MPHRRKPWLRHWHSPRRADVPPTKALATPLIFTKFGPSGGRMSHRRKPWLRHWHSRKVSDREIIIISRAVASLTVPGEQEFEFPNFSSNFDQFFLFFAQTWLIFFLILALGGGRDVAHPTKALATPLIILIDGSVVTMSEVSLFDDRDLLANVDISMCLCYG